MTDPFSPSESRIAFRFVLLIGVLSFFADFTYEGARSVIGPYLATLGASAAIVGIVAGFGELVGYGLRLISGRAADASGRFWAVAILGYVIQMVSVPALALTGSWPAAAALIVLERIGKAIRNPPRDVMLSHAGTRVGGYGWVFGVHEAMDQFGALFGPLMVAAVLARRGSYHLAFAALLVPAAINLAVLTLARLLYPRPQDLEPTKSGPANRRFPLVYWVYLAGAAMVAAGFADYPLIAYHFTTSDVLPREWVAIAYAIAMGVSGSGSLLFGRLFDRHGFRVLVALSAVSLLFAPLVFLAGKPGALLGVALWRLGIGVHESIIPAAVAPMVPPDRRASAFGMFTGVYGFAWFLGSAAIGVLYDYSVAAAVTFCMVSGALAIPAFLWVSQRTELDLAR